ncbi:MAG: hypothetical protein Q8N51_06095, partial [Gammaproteobacteria bacterium]|nr:hypothetical protein [Gammaproteobacteria bacterium]
QLRVWNEPPLDAASREMAQWHGRVNWARLHSPALQSPNQYFLSRTGGGDNSKIFAVAKYEASGAVANGKDAVLAFALFVNAGDHSGASDTYDLAGCWSQLGLVNSATNYYNVRNLASSQATQTLWTTARSGADLHANGIWVNFTSDGGGTNIYADGAIVQYLKIEPAAAPGTETTNSPAPVPYVWLDGYYPGSHTPTEYEQLAMQNASNGVMKVWQAYVANLNPTDANDFFQFTHLQSVTSPVARSVSVKVAEDRAYRIEFATTPLTNSPMAWTSFQAAGAWTNLSPYTNRHVFFDDGSTNTSGSALGAQRTYRVWVGIP